MPGNFDMSSLLSGMGGMDGMPDMSAMNIPDMGAAEGEEVDSDDEGKLFLSG